MSIFFAALSAASLLLLSAGYVPDLFLWMTAAAGVQLRLLCNLMDGMLAVEGGLKTPNGDLFNEFPDRLSDVLILSSLGFAGGDGWSTTLGWLCACGSLTTACIRMHGASLLGTHDFRGPMAKPQRMALTTFACLVMVFLESTGLSLAPMPWILGLMLTGIVITISRRLVYLSRTLQEKASDSSTKS